MVKFDRTHCFPYAGYFEEVKRVGLQITFRFGVGVTEVEEYILIPNTESGGERLLRKSAPLTAYLLFIGLEVRPPPARIVKLLIRHSVPMRTVFVAVYFRRISLFTSAKLKPVAEMRAVEISLNS